MTTHLNEAMTAGVLFEYRDEEGNTVGQAVFTAWEGRPLPAAGDTVSCQVTRFESGRCCTMRGVVESRRFEIQHDDGQPSVWAHVVVVESTRSLRRRARAPFSIN